MTTKANVDNFLALKKYAIVGISRNPKKFGNYIFKNLKDKGYELFPVHPELKEYEGVKCYSNLKELNGKVEGLVLNIPPDKTVDVLTEAADAGINYVWLQQGSSNEEVIKFCEKNNIKYVDGQCIIMFTEPVQSFHKFHRFIWKLIGKYPK